MLKELLVLAGLLGADVDEEVDDEVLEDVVDEDVAADVGLVLGALDVAGAGALGAAEVGC